MKKNSLLFLLIILVLFTKKSYSDNLDNIVNMINEENLIKNQPEDRFTQFVKIRALDKVAAESILLDTKIGEIIKFKNLEILPLKCWKSYPNEKVENKLLLKVYDKKELIFYGWFFSSTPSISGIEHNLYDLKLINCYNIETNQEGK